MKQFQNLMAYINGIISFAQVWAGLSGDPLRIGQGSLKAGYWIICHSFKHLVVNNGLLKGILTHDVSMWLGLHTTWCLSFKGEHPRERNPSRSCVTISNLAWEVTLHHLHHFLFVGVATSLPRLKRWRNRFQLLMGNSIEEYIGLEILLWLFLENTSCHRLLLA